MTKRLIIEEEVFYLSLQDGRADDNEYSTHAEADKALKKLPKMARLSTYVTSRIKRTPFP